MARLPIPWLLVVALAACGCKTRDRRFDADGAATTDAGAGSHASAAKAGAWFPMTLDAAAYAGADACADCHRAVYDLWRGSPHGRSMVRATPASVRGDFSGTPVRLPDGTVTPRTSGADLWMDIDSASGHQTYRVELALASGRQHQLYLTRGLGDTLQLLPIYYATRTREWVSTSLQRQTSLDARDPRHFSRVEVVTDGNCLHCHLSQGRSRVVGDRVEIAWTDLSINCEACHGPARAHVEARRAGREGPPLVNPKNLSGAEEAALCGRCHAAQHAFHDARRADLQFSTPASPLLRADGRQLGTAYQYAGHVSSACFARGAATCTGCHDPHRQTPRDLSGASAEGARSDRQCTVCHRDRLDDKAARRHTHHAGAVRCIDCHMAEQFIFDDPGRRQRVADHTISIPRPQETIDLQLPNACANCHAQPPSWALDALRRWGAVAATKTRPFVQAVELAKHRDPRATPLLLGALGDDKTTPFERATVLELLGNLPPDPAVVAAVARFAGDPDPYLRGLALRALFIHDPPRAESWAAGAANDSDPMVRVMAIDALGRAPLTEAQLGRIAEDMVTLAEMPPAEGLRFLSRKTAALGRTAESLRFGDLAGALSTPLQKQQSTLQRR